MDKNQPYYSILRIVSQIAILVGIVVSFYFVMDVGKGDFSYPVRSLFVVWTLLPLFALLIANLLSKNWSRITRLGLYVLTLSVTLISTLGYSGILSPPMGKQTVMLAAIPLLCWALTITIMFAASSFADRDNKRR